MENSRRSNIHSGSIIFKNIDNILAFVKQFISYLTRRWVSFIISFFLPVVLMIMYVKMSDPKYLATRTFIISDEESGKLNVNLSTLLGRMGTGTSKANYYKIVELTKSRKIVSQALLLKDTALSHEIVLGNYLIDYFKLKDNDGSINYFKSVNTSDFSQKENFLALRLQDLIFGSKGIASISFDEKSGLIKLEVVTRDENLSIATNNCLYKVISDFFVEKSIEKEKRTYELLQAKADSVYRRMNLETKQSFVYEDKSLGVWQQSNRINQVTKDRDSKISLVVYTEAIKNLELSDFTLKMKTPYFQVIDYPVKPLLPQSISISKAIIVGFVLGFIIITIIISMSIFKAEYQKYKLNLRPAK